MAYGAAGTVITGSPPAVRCFNSAAISIPHNVDTVVTFDSNRFDPTGMHSTVTNTSRITFASPGVYSLMFSGELAAATDYQTHYAYFRLNGSTVIGVGNSAAVTGGAPGCETNAATIYKFAANDYIEVLVRHVNGAAAARNLNSVGNYTPELAAVWVGLGT